MQAWLTGHPQQVAACVHLHVEELRGRSQGKAGVVETEKEGKKGGSERRVCMYVCVGAPLGGVGVDVVGRVGRQGRR